MTRQEYKNLIHQLPQTLFDQYKFKEPYDFSNTSCIHTEEYDYYPEECIAIINEMIVTWDKNLPYADPRIPEHLAEMKARVAERLRPDIKGLIHLDSHDKMKCKIYRSARTILEQHTIPFDNCLIYYNPSEIDLKNNIQAQTLAKCLFARRRYSAEYIIPHKNENPQDWGC